MMRSLTNATHSSEKHSRTSEIAACPQLSCLKSKLLWCPRLQALLKMDCQGLVARLVMDFVLLTTAVEVAGRWRELAERLTKVSRSQMDAYEAPHRDKNGVVDSEVGAARQHVWIDAYGRCQRGAE